MQSPQFLVNSSDQIPPRRMQKISPQCKHCSENVAVVWETWWTLRICQ